MSKANITLNDFQTIKFILVRNGIRSGNARCKERRTSQMINEKAFDLKSVYLSMSLYYWLTIRDFLFSQYFQLT